MEKDPKITQEEINTNGVNSEVESNNSTSTDVCEYDNWYAE